MSLGARFSWFFLIALALVLGGFSGCLYLLERNAMVQGLDQRLKYALDTLEAAVDIEPDGLEWEPEDRQLSLGVDRGARDVRWALRNSHDKLVDRSANSIGTEFPSDWAPEEWPRGLPNATVYGDAPGWRLAARRLELAALLRSGRGHPNDEPEDDDQFRVLVVVTGLNPAPIEAACRRLAMMLIGLSVGVWVLAAAAGLWLARRALAPLNRMARAATAMTADNLAHRLPSPGTGDELDALSRAFNGLLDRLELAFLDLHEVHERQRRFVGDAAHQLRTPLAALMGQVQVALRRDRSSEEYRNALKRVHGESARLRRIIESLLLLDRPDGSLPDPEPLDLAAWARESFERWEAHPRASDLVVQVEKGPPLRALANAPLLAQVLDNLIENACKYSPPGTPIIVRAWRENGTIALGVEDQGPGLSPEEAERAFEPFYRAEGARRGGQSGVGLGLAVARRIAHSFGGTLEVRAARGTGSLFVLRLPEWDQGQVHQDRAPRKAPAPAITGQAVS